VLKAHLGDDSEVNPNAWPAASKLFEYAYGREPEQGIDSFTLPEGEAEVANLSWAQLRIHNGEAGRGAPAANAITNAVPVVGNGDGGGSVQ
jgi:hypothetical protein